MIKQLEEDRNVRDGLYELIDKRRMQIILSVLLLIIDTWF